ncbi:MAG: hypothetical protein HWN65_08840 [Candidatus Helarchaeota archaeon]|nr:hypothetical protein [Candidatus Helarchaeota archaeon]
MTNMTFSIPDEIYKKMKEHPEIKWSQIARSALIKYIENLELAEEIISKSTLKIEDVEEIGAEIKRKAWELHKKRMEDQR